MVSFESDYIMGAHPEILRRLVETNFEAASGYGGDKYCASAMKKIAAACGCPEADVRFIVGGTQTNAVVISSMLNRYQAVISADTGHIGFHEAGAIEYTGHKVILLPHNNGKINADALGDYLATFHADANHLHMAEPGMVYISHPTEYGTLYSKDELTDISAVCREYSIPLFLDGARLGYGLMSYDTDVSLEDIARLYKLVAAVEEQHKILFQYLREAVRKGTLYQCDHPVLWVCSQCGHSHVATQAWKVCPLCKAEQGYVNLHLPFDGVKE